MPDGALTSLSSRDTQALKRGHGWRIAASPASSAISGPCSV